MITFLIYFLVVLIIIGLVWWLIDALPLPEPLNRIARIVVIVVGCLVIILMLLRLAGVDVGALPR